jgi:alginate O-acetyltransferase complex protein AlgI
MTLTFILICAGASLPFMWLVPGRWRPWGLLAASLIAMGWLQGDTAGGSGMFLLPAATLILTLAVWWIVQPEASPYTRENRLALALMGSALALIWLAMPGNDRPGLDAVLPGLGLACAAAVSVSYMLPAKTQNEQAEPYRRAAVLLITLITLVLLVMKSATLTRFFSQWLGNTSPADPAITLSWLGFSYFAFRLISVLIDFRGGRLLQDGLPLRDMAIYVLFFPALTAGPIDRVQRFIPELNETNPQVWRRSSLLRTAWHW